MTINIANAQNVNIPDLQFKATLLNNPAINTNGDGEIQVTEAAAYTGGINAFNSGIYDLTGIEAFTALDNLDCSYNYLTSLNMSANVALTGLWCDNNQFTSLDVSANTALTHLSCQSNQFTSLDVSANKVLTWLYCQSNQLTSLNVQNGNNSNFTHFNATSNPNLTCIQVDNVAYSNANWNDGKDATASFSTNCGASSVPDIGNLANVQIFPNPAVNHLTIDLGSNNQKVEVTITDITGKIIYTTTARETQKLEVNTNDFAEGIYVVRIQAADFIGTKKLVVEK